MPLFPRRGWRAMTSLEIVGLLLLALLAGAMWREVVWRLRKRQLEQAAIDRKSVVEGTSVDSGGRRIIKKKKHKKRPNHTDTILT